jgi:hypothetical protein
MFGSSARDSVVGKPLRGIATGSRTLLGLPAPNESVSDRLAVCGVALCFQHTQYAANSLDVKERCGRSPGQPLARGHGQR